jgi:excisionase family DNA binding protein
LQASDSTQKEKIYMTQETPFGAASVRSELLTRREAAAYLGVSEQTLAIWKCTGRYNLPYIKIGRLVKYKRQDLDAFITRNYNTALA